LDVHDQRFAHREPAAIGFAAATGDRPHRGAFRFSYGTYPSGPLRLDPQEPEALSSARFGEDVITSDDIVFADDDGVAFVPADRVDEVLDAARAIWQVEREQASRIAAGETLRAQTSSDEYLSRRANDLSYTLRQHLRQIGGAIEE
jgi:4-hydroxy-4-methyl-2-oxoglutarate aldolase